MPHHARPVKLSLDKLEKLQAHVVWFLYPSYSWARLGAKGRANKMNHLIFNRSSTPHESAALLCQALFMLCLDKSMASIFPQREDGSIYLELAA